MKNILVIGATGPQGRPVAEQLVAAGFKVRALVRNPAKAEDLAAKGVEIVKGDLGDAASVSAAVRGQDGVFMLISFFTGTHEQANTVIDAAVEHRVQKIVWTVAAPIQPEAIGNEMVDKWYHTLVSLQQSGIPYTVLQPTVYMENFLIPAIAQEVAEKNVLAYPMPEIVRAQWISHLDNAAYVVAAFGSENRENLQLTICGPEKLAGADIAERFSKALGREITFRPMPPEEFAKAISFGGNEQSIVDHYQMVFNHPEIMTTDIDHQKALDLLAIEPVSIEDWARTYRGYLSNS